MSIWELGSPVRCHHTNRLLLLPFQSPSYTLDLPFLVYKDKGLWAQTNYWKYSFAPRQHSSFLLLRRLTPIR